MTREEYAAIKRALRERLPIAQDYEPSNAELKRNADLDCPDEGWGELLSFGTIFDHSEWGTEDEGQLPTREVEPEPPEHPSLF
jgi:hypothetical protein